MRNAFTEGDVAVAVADLDSVGETRAGAGVASKRCRSDAQAGSDVLDYYARSGAQVREAAEEAHAPQLDGEAETRAVTALAVDIGTLGWPGLKEAVQLLGGGVAVEGPVATGLLVGEELYRHGLGPPTTSRGLRGPGSSENLVDGSAGLAGQGSAAELENELPVGQLVTLIGVLDSVRQLARVHLCVPTGPALWRTWHPITLPRL